MSSGTLNVNFTDKVSLELISWASWFYIVLNSRFEEYQNVFVHNIHIMQICAFTLRMGHENLQVEKVEGVAEEVGFAAGEGGAKVEGLFLLI